MGAVTDPELILLQVREWNRYRRMRIHAVALMRGSPPAAFQGTEDASRALAFMRRLAFVDWRAPPQGPALFTASPVALVHWAPIAPELKKHDTEIIENSIRFTWREVRQQFERRIDGAGVAAELSSLAGPGKQS